MAKGINVKTWMNNKQVVAAVKQASIAPLARCAFMVEAEAKRSMKTGGRITGSSGGMTKTPSAPGEPPHVQTGNLRASIQTGATLYGTYVVGPTLQAWYGKLLEFGSRMMAKRPFMRPALERTKNKFPGKFKEINLARTPAGQILNRAKGPL